MAIVDLYGNAYSYSRKPARSAEQHTNQRPWEPTDLKNIGDLVPANDRKVLLSASRKLFLNLGPARGAIEQKAMYSVGRAWNPKFTGEDSDFGTAAASWLANTWYGVADVRGGMHDFKTTLYLLSTAIDRDGEAFVLLTESKAGFPRIQHIPAHRIGNPNNVKDDKMRGGMLIDGIICNSDGAPREYALLTTDGKLQEWIPAQDIIHLYDPSWQEQGRGLPAFTHALNDLRDMLQSHEWERMAQLMLSSIGLIEHNEHGGADMDDNGTVLAGNTTTQTGVTVERLEGGSVRYFKANSGAKLDTIVSDRPGEVWESFHDRIIRSSLAGINWPYSMVWKATGQGTAERSELGKAQRAVEDRQDILFYFARRVVGYAVAKAQKTGSLAKSADWWKWEFTMPSKLTIDDGRVAKELESMWKIGARNMRDIVGMMGKDLGEHYRERAEEIAMRKMAAKEASAKYGVEIEDRDMAMLTPNEQPESAKNNQDGNQ